MTSTMEGTDGDRLYTRQFFQVFGAVTLFMTGFALQFHFGEYVEYLGHGVDTLGWVLGISMVGTLLIRLHIGRSIDRFGCRPMWLVGTLVVTVTVGSIQFTDRLWLIIVLRMLFYMAFASVMTTVAVFAAVIAPSRRKAESLGTIGLGGFSGMIIGPTLGDWIFSGAGESILPYRIFFSTSAACSLLAGIAMTLINLPAACSPRQARPSDASAPSQPGPSQTRVILTHWPGAILLVGVAFCMVLSWQLTFLERLAEARGFMNIKVFFLTYGPTAILLRIVCRRVPERLGRTRTLVGGLLLQGVGVLCLVAIHTEWQLILPALLMGAGHCFVFPSMVDLSAERLPPEYRGTGTSLILGAGDLGLLAGLIVLGEVIDRLGYDAALFLLAATVLTTAVLFAITRRHVVFARRRRP